VPGLQSSDELTARGRSEERGRFALTTATACQSYEGISLPPIRGTMWSWSGRLCNGPARPPGGSSAWRAARTGSPGAL